MSRIKVNVKIDHKQTYRRKNMKRKKDKEKETLRDDFMEKITDLCKAIPNSFRVIFHKKIPKNHLPHGCQKASLKSTIAIIRPVEKKEMLEVCFTQKLIHTPTLADKCDFKVLFSEPAKLGNEKVERILLHRSIQGKKQSSELLQIIISPNNIPELHNGEFNISKIVGYPIDKVIV